LNFFTKTGSREKLESEPEPELASELKLDFESKLAPGLSGFRSENLLKKSSAWGLRYVVYSRNNKSRF
jgi:hypothetical protein